jgi:hypothetical protein
MRNIWRQTANHLGPGMSYTDITTRVALFGEFASEEFIKFGAKYTVGDELALFADLGCHEMRQALKEGKNS